MILAEVDEKILSLRNNYITSVFVVITRNIEDCVATTLMELDCLARE